MKEKLSVDEKNIFFSHKKVFKLEILTVFSEPGRSRHARKKKDNIKSNIIDSAC